MARSKANLAEALAEPQTEAPEVTESAPEQPQKPAKSAQKRTPAKRTRKASKPTQKRTQSAKTSGAVEQTGTEPRVLVPASTNEGKRTPINLHVDDYKALAMAKLENGTDINSLMRAMIALYRANARYRTQVDRLARTAPRGGSV